jgi:hypothetical protein
MLQIVRQAIEAEVGGRNIDIFADLVNRICIAAKVVARYSARWVDWTAIPRELSFFDLLATPIETG